ncbi:hypothetical protein FKM82_030886 [Ascaphus truei]
MCAFLCERLSRWLSLNMPGFRERSLPCVFPLVFVQVGKLTKSLPTFLTYMRSLPCVCPLVCIQVG